jgi:ADP-L-glycero-D-manno-heptose 6-epimerase
MASVAFHFFQQYQANRRVQLFDGSGGYPAGEQRRDFVFVDDVVAVNLEFLDHPERSGIYNLGSGHAQTFNEVAVATINACRAADGQAPLSVAELVRAGTIEYIEFPPQLVGKYQSFTQADLSALRAAGYRAPMTTVEHGVAAYVERLMAGGAAAAVT